MPDIAFRRSKETTLLDGGRLCERFNPLLTLPPSSDGNRLAFRRAPNIRKCPCPRIAAPLALPQIRRSCVVTHTVAALMYGTTPKTRRWRMTRARGRHLLPLHGPALRCREAPPPFLGFRRPLPSPD